MLPTRFDTFELPLQTQFEAWRDQYRDVFDLTLADAAVPQYPAEHTAWSFGGLRLTRASMPSDVIRHWRHWNRPKLDDWMLVVAPNATKGLATDRMPRLTFRSLTRRFESDGSDGEVVSLFLPREQFIKQAKALDSIEPWIPFSGRVALMGDYLLALESRLRLLSVEEMGPVAEATRAIVVACIVPTAENLERARTDLSQMLAKKARRLILQNLHVPGYGPEPLARDLGMSRSALYRAFQPIGGVAAIILQERLDAAHRRLVEASRRESVGEIALSLGFSDHSGFSRAFKKRFGYTPKSALGREL